MSINLTYLFSHQNELLCKSLRNIWETLVDAKKNRIAELREAKGWSQTALAEAIVPPTSKMQIYQIESGRRGLTYEWMLRIAAALGCEPHELITPKDMVLGKLPIYDGDVPAGAPQCLEEPGNIERYIHGQVRNSKCFAKRIKDNSRSMDRVALPGQYILVDPTVTDTGVLDGKCVLAYYDGECTFKRFFKEPMRLVPDSNSPDYATTFIPEYSDFRIIGWVYGTSSEL